LTVFVSTHFEFSSLPKRVGHSTGMLSPILELRYFHAFQVDFWLFTSMDTNDLHTRNQLSRDQLPHDQLLEYQLFMKSTTMRSTLMKSTLTKSTHRTYEDKLNNA